MGWRNLAKPQIKSISFKDEYSEEFNFLISQSNPSQFVCELIREHMNSSDNFEQRVKEVLLKYFGEQQQIISQPTHFQEESYEEDLEDPWSND